jgi:hypothetical protein
MGKLLEGCRRSFGPAPRSFSMGDRRHLSPLPPFWLLIRPKDRIWTLYKERSRLVSSGQVVWSAFVQANSLLFEPGSEDCPAAAVYSLDPRFDNEPGGLGRIAHALFALKGSVPSDPALQELVHDITDEMERTYNLRVPDSLTDGREVFLTCIMVHRRHLPEGYLKQGLVPLVVNPAVTGATMILPSRYWGPELRYFWGMPRR